MPNTLNFAVDKLSANRRPCRGVGSQYRVEKLARLLCKFWPYKYSKSGLHAFYRTYYPDYVFSEETGKFCHREDHGFLCDTITGHAKNINKKISGIRAYWNNMV